MSYAHITLDVGAAIKTFHVIWNRSAFQSDSVIHLGLSRNGGPLWSNRTSRLRQWIRGCTVSGRSLHLQKHQQCYQRKHCNRLWHVHESFSEAYNRKAFSGKIFCHIPKIAAEFAKFSRGSRKIQDILIEQKNKKICLKGNFGSKTPQFWMIYTDLVDRQRKLHFAINDKGFSLRLLMWKKSLPICFATNRDNYSRYGNYYLKLLECLESTHPGTIYIYIYFFIYIYI